nr:MAG TPA: hypothetical protein [Caudoviricetes sp.]
MTIVCILFIFYVPFIVFNLKYMSTINILYTLQHDKNIK